MGRPYSEDLRRRIVAAEGGLSCNAAARQFSVSASCAIKLLQRWRRTGAVVPGPRGKKPYVLADQEGLVRELIATHPYMTIDELHEELGRRTIRVGRSSIGRFVLARGLTFKKDLHAAEQQWPDIAAAREILRTGQSGLNPDRFVFIDETWATTNMTRLRGRAPRGQRLAAAVPHGNWKTSTFVAALRTSGLTAPLIVDGAMNG